MIKTGGNCRAWLTRETVYRVTRQRRLYGGLSRPLRALLANMPLRGCVGRTGFSSSATLLIINFNCPDIAKEVRRPGSTQLINVQWINAESRLSEAYCNSIEMAITQAKK